MSSFARKVPWNCPYISTSQRMCVGVVLLVPLVRSVRCTGDSVSALTNPTASLVSLGDAAICAPSLLTSPPADVQVGSRNKIAASVTKTLAPFSLSLSPPLPPPFSLSFLPQSVGALIPQRTVQWQQVSVPAQLW